MTKRAVELAHEAARHEGVGPDLILSAVKQYGQDMREAIAKRFDERAEACLSHGRRSLYGDQMKSIADEIRGIPLL